VKAPLQLRASSFRGEKRERVCLGISRTGQLVRYKKNQFRKKKGERRGLSPSLFAEKKKEPHSILSPDCAEMAGMRKRREEKDSPNISDVLEEKGGSRSPFPPVNCWKRLVGKKKKERKEGNSAHLTPQRQRKKEKRGRRLVVDTLRETKDEKKGKSRKEKGK